MLQLPTPILGNISAITITTPDFATSIAFYQTLGFKEVARADWPFPWVQVSDGVLLIMLRKTPDPYIALTYFTAGYSRVFKELESKGITFTEQSGPKDMVKRCAFQSPDGVNIRIVGITDGFSHPPGPGMLQMPQEDYFNPSKYVNKTIGLFGELAQPVKDLHASTAFWRKLGFTTLSEFTNPYPWCVMTDGLMAVGLHQTEHFAEPAITFFAADMRQKITSLKEKGLTNYNEKGPSNIVLNTPEQQHIFLFQMGAENEATQPSLTDIKQVTLETERLLLKGITPDIMKHLFVNHTEADIREFLGIETDEEMDMERNRYHNGLSWYRNTSLHFIMRDRQTNKRIGRLGYHTWAVEHSRAEIGYHIYHEEDKGKGYMKEAMAAVLKYGFHQMGLNRIEAMVGSQNLPSLKLMEHFGFTREGVLRSHYCKNGILEDSVCFGLLRSEYAV